MKKFSLLNYSSWVWLKPTAEMPNLILKGFFSTEIQGPSRETRILKASKVYISNQAFCCLSLLNCWTLWCLCIFI